MVHQHCKILISDSIIPLTFTELEFFHKEKYFPYKIGEILLFKNMMPVDMPGWVLNIAPFLANFYHVLLVPSVSFLKDNTHTHTNRWSVVCVILTGPWGGQISLVKYYSGRFWMRLTFEWVDWVNQIALPNRVGPHPISWRPE